MSDWRLDLKALYDAGGTASTAQWGSYNGCRDLRNYGLAKMERDPLSDGRHYVYKITPKGRDVVEGRITLKPRGKLGGGSGHRPWAWVATWLSALPRGDFAATRV